MFQPLEGEGGAEGATGFEHPCFGWICILMEIKFTGNSPELRGTHPKARHLSRVWGGMGQGGVGVMDMRLPAGPGQAGFLITLMGPLAWKGGGGDVWPEVREVGLRQPGDGGEKAGRGEGWEPWTGACGCSRETETERALAWREWLPCSVSHLGR